jgi:DNA repair protein REV1
MKEFQYMKVVKPEWLVQSVEADTLLPWRDFIFQPGKRVEASQGRKTAQRSLLNGFVTQKSTATTLLPADAHSSNVEVNEEAVAYPASPVPVAGPSTSPHQRPKSAANSPSRRLYTTDPSTPEETERVPEYAADKSNIAAQRAMADPAWRAAHTSVAPDFIEGYYRNSRLHHLSTWKAELRNLVAEAQERAEDGTSASTGMPAEGFSTSDPVSKIMQENLEIKGGAGGAAENLSMKGVHLMKKNKGKGKEKAADADVNRVIMHCDFDSFFVAAGLVDRPSLRGKPVVVCHSQGAQGGQSSTSEIASASYEAREFGIRSGMR